MPASRAATLATVAASICAVLAMAAPAEAKQARCYNSDDGNYTCDFQQYGGDGSFRVSAPLKPTYTISIVRRGVADGFADYGSGNRALPGPFLRSKSDRACWVSDATQFQLCAY